MDVPTDDELLGIDLYGGDKDDCGVRLHSSRMVTTRKAHTCRFLDPHEIPLGSRARIEKALIDNEWTKFYVCCNCLERAWEEIYAT